jgi:hypothetical protein
LEQIFNDFKNSEKEEKEEREDDLPKVPLEPEPVDHEGNYFFDFYQLQKEHPEISSKKALLPFLCNELFLSLTLTCSHEMPWLNPFCEEHNLDYEASRQEGLYQVVISHKTCKTDKSMTTKYGKLEGYVSDVYHSNHQLKEVMLTQRNELLTPFGKLIPKYQVTEARDKFRNSLSFFSNGNLKSIYLEERIYVNTSIGSVIAEFLTFYEGGSIHRIFPKYGQLSGFWSEENEYENEPIFHLDLRPCRIDNKVTSFTFYPQGELAAFTIANTERISIDTPLGRLNGRHGLALHQNGNIKSMEPAYPIKLQTILGTATVYDTQAIGIHADKNSLEFDKEGELISMAVVAESLRVEGDFENVVISPKCVASQLDPEQREILPIYISITPEFIKIRKVMEQESQYKRDSYRFCLEPYQQYCSNLVTGGCTSCSGCSSLASS